MAAQAVVGTLLLIGACVCGIIVCVAAWLVKSGRANGEQDGAIVASILPTGRDKQAR